MKIRIVHICAIAAAASVLSSLAAGGGKMKISSSAFKNGANIPSQFTCDGSDKNPTLQIEGIPAGAKTLALIVDDPDAPSGLFTHWLVWNIPPQTSSVAEGVPPKGVQGTNDFGKSAYGGPCPPSGTHRYFFKIFALDREVDLPAAAKRKDVDAKISGHVIAQGELMGRYSKEK
jgi:Raf kinase inhibitor-like YbhB/YbcL family protein